MTIRISDKLKSEVIAAVHDRFRPQLEAAHKAKPDVGDEIYSLLYGPHVEDMNRLPDGFLHTTTAITTSRIGGRPVTAEFALSAKRRVAFRNPTNEDFDAPVGYSDRLVINRTGRTAHIVDQVFAWQDGIKAVMEARENAQEAVRGILKRYASLPPAIKAFPPLVDLLPPEVRKKIDVPQHRLSSVDMEINPHLKNLATIIAMQKILNV